MLVHARGATTCIGAFLQGNYVLPRARRLGYHYVVESRLCECKVSYQVVLLSAHSF